MDDNLIDQEAAVPYSNSCRSSFSSSNSVEGSSSHCCNNNSDNSNAVVALTSMLEVAKLMREQDAELLESMRFTDSCSTGTTPTLQPSKSPSLSDIPALTELVESSHNVVCLSSSSSSSRVSTTIRRDSSSHRKQQLVLASQRFERSSSNHSHSLCRRDSMDEPSSSSTADELMINVGDIMRQDDGDLLETSIRQEALHLLPQQEQVLSERELSNGVLYRQCLSGDVRLAVENNNDGDDENDENVVVVVHGDDRSSAAAANDDDDISNNNNAEHATTTAAAVAVASSPISVTQTVEERTEQIESRIVRTKSMDRRMCEAYQFAEAVGEIIPPLINQAIIEEGGSDDDDDDTNAKEIRLDEATNCRQDSSTTTIIVTKRTLVRSGAIDNAVAADAGAGPSKVMMCKTRPQWPFSSGSRHHSTFLFQLPDGVSTPDFVYKGICANPPEITTHGISRGNYAQLHRKAWLEVSDKYHRYGKNLRLYYRYWENLGFPTNSFFDWLDSKGEAAGEPLPNLEDCPRSQLDSDTVLYITNPDVTHGYSLNVIPDGQGRGLVLDVDGEKVKTGSEGWIFVLRDNVMYGALKITSISGHSKQRFHHSSFFGGKAVAAAGIIFTDDEGYLIRLYPHSGHYRPGEAHIQRMLFFLHHKGVDLRTFEMDTQQILHVARDGDATTTTTTTTTTTNPNTSNTKKGDNGDKNSNTVTTITNSNNTKTKTNKNKGSGVVVGEKKKKVQSLHLKPAVYVACFLAHKARFIGAGIFTIVHKIRKADVTTVSEALDAVDEGGYWKKMIAREKCITNSRNEDLTMG